MAIINYNLLIEILDEEVEDFKKYFKEWIYENCNVLREKIRIFNQDKENLKND